MKAIKFILPVLAIFTASLTYAQNEGHPQKDRTDADKANRKVTLIHKGHTIEVSREAAKAHLKHGDTFADPKMQERFERKRKQRAHDRKENGNRQKRQRQADAKSERMHNRNADGTRRPRADQQRQRMQNQR